MTDVMSKQRTAGQTGPLRGLLVLDFGQAAVGPIAAEYPRNARGYRNQG